MMFDGSRQFESLRWIFRRGMGDGNDQDLCLALMVTSRQNDRARAIFHALFATFAMFTEP